MKTWIAILGWFFIWPVSVVAAEVRVALVIGNAAYQYSTKLDNPTNDAKDVAASLERLGFKVALAIDASENEIHRAMKSFDVSARGADVALFYYSGHGMQHNGRNYLFPIDVHLKGVADLEKLLDVREVAAIVRQASSFHVTVLDACRDNPLAESFKRSIGANYRGGTEKGLTSPERLSGGIVGYATQAGETADDGTGMRNSPYTKAFLSNIEKKVDVATVFGFITSEVLRDTNRRQRPEFTASMDKAYYLNGFPLAAPASKAENCDGAADHWKATESLKTAKLYEDHLARFPKCAFVELAKSRLAEIRKPVPQYDSRGFPTAEGEKALCDRARRDPNAIYFVHVPGGVHILPCDKYWQ